MDLENPEVVAALEYLRIEPGELMKQQAAPFDAKKSVWIATKKDDPMGYIAAEVESTEGEMVTVRTAKGEVKEVKKEDCDQMNPPKYEKCTDMANLTFLNEASVLYNLEARYKAGLIYTYSGLFCVAVNPYRRLPIYTDTVVQMYRGKRRPEMPPHVFSIVDNAYQDMLIDHNNQSMLITGESGAGKTENTKKVIQYIAKVAGVDKKPEPEGPPKPGEVAKIKGDLDEQVVEANPLLEAFGNAKTTRNNNSSRFGKFIRCHFGATGKLAGADIESYLLEKNRVTDQGCQERNYHIFYQLLYATTDEDLAKMCLPTRDAKSYGFLSAGVTHVDKIDDHEEYGYTINAINVLGFVDEEKWSMFKITAAILNFSNMKFKQKKDEQAEVDDPADGERVAYLIGLPIKEFLMSLVKPKVKVGTEYVNKGQNVTQVLYAISALCKSLFERMFLWIVIRVNKALDTKEKRAYFIGVLDIAGFEIFEYNSFDQLCINFTNERLQQFFNHHMFVLEQEEYKKEGIAWDNIDFGMDLENTLNLIEKPMGIFAMLEEECIVPKATDKTYLDKLHKQHAGKNTSYTKPTPKQTKQGGGDFILHHYAGSVGYSVAGWLEKNKDPINEHTAQLFSKATDPLTASLFQDYNPDVKTKRKGAAFQTVSARHKEQLKNLMSTLMATSPHFVRCIIPNENKAPGEIDGQLTLHQLRCNGVLEGIRICRKGFPSRMPFQDFKQRYRILAASAVPEGFIDGKVAAEKLVDALQLDENEFRIGLTKVFFRAGIIGELEEMRDERLSRIISQFQAYMKGHLMRIEFKKMLDRKIGLQVIQRNIRKFFLMRNWTWWKLYVKVQPMLSVARAEDEMKEKEEELRKAMEDAEANAKRKAELEESLTTVMGEKDKLFSELQTTSEMLNEAEEELAVTSAAKAQLEKDLAEAQEKLEGEEHASSKLSERIKKTEKQLDDAQNKSAEQKENISRLEGEKASLGKQIESLNEEIKDAGDSYAKLNKEKKGVEETLAERDSQLSAAEDKISNLNKVKSKNEGTIKELEFTLQKEKDARAKLDKEKRKLEGDLKDTKDKLTETEGSLKTAQDTVVKRDKAIRELEEIKETNESLIKQLQKKVAELLRRIEELEEELENERKLRQKTELARKDLESQLEELNEQLEIQGGATNAQVEVSKKKDAECARLRKEIEEINQANDEAAAAAKAKFNAALAEAQDEADALKAAKSKSDKDKAAIANELSDAQSAIEAAKKAKVAADKNNRNLDDQCKDLQGKLSDLEAALTEAEGKATKGSGEAASLSRSLDESEHKLAVALKNNKNLEAALKAAKSAAEDEAKAKSGTVMKLNDALAEIDALNEQLEDEQSGKMELQAKLSRATAEFNAMKGNFAEGGGARVDELEDAKKKLMAKVQEMEEALSAAECKASGMEKVKNRMNEEVEDLLLDLEQAQVTASQLEKKQKKVDAQINEWKSKCDEITAELEKTQRDHRSATSEIIKLRSNNEDTEEKYDAMRKENKALAAELASCHEQLNDGGKSHVEVEKLRRKLGLENEELQAALEEAELALEVEEGKFLKLQLEFTQLKQSTDRVLAAKEEEIESSRKNHHRQLESLQGTLDAEVKTKAELQRSRKKAETDLLDMESQVDSANRSSNEYQKTIKKLQSQMKELQSMVEDEGRGRDESRDAINRAERRANELAVLLDEARVALEQAERAKKLAEVEKAEQVDRVGEMQALYNNAANAKRKAEADYHALQEEIEELETAAQASEDKATKAMAEIARLMNEVNAAHDSAQNADKSRACLAKQVADLGAQLEEMDSGKGLKGQIRKLEGRIIELESDLDTEGRKSADIVKQARKADKRVKEVLFQLEDERKAGERAADAAEKMNNKNKKLRMQLEEMEAQNSQLQSKYKKAVAELDESEERSEAAEQALQKARARARGASQAATRGGSRAPSGARTPRSRTAKPDED